MKCTQKPFSSGCTEIPSSQQSCSMLFSVNVGVVIFMHAAIRVRGVWGVQTRIEKAMEMLSLTRVNHCVLVQSNPESLGQLKKAKDYITFGKINEKTLAKLLMKRGKLSGDKKISLDFLKKNNLKSFEELAEALIEGKNSLKKLEIKPVFRLHPPRKGHQRKGIKKSFSVGGALGERKEKINDLLNKMM